LIQKGDLDLCIAAISDLLRYDESEEIKPHIENFIRSHVPMKKKNTSLKNPEKTKSVIPKSFVEANDNL
jgi:hypothetical protein